MLLRTKEQLQHSSKKQLQKASFAHVGSDGLKFLLIISLNADSVIAFFCLFQAHKFCKDNQKKVKQALKPSSDGSAILYLLSVDEWKQ